MLVDLSYFNYGLFLLLFLTIFSFSFVILGKKNIWNIADHMVYAFFALSINLSLVLYFFYEGRVCLFDALYAVSCQLSFILALRISSNFFRKRFYQIKMKTIVGPSKSLSYYLLGVAVSLKFIYICFIFKKVGLGFLTGDAHPDLKLMVFLEGSGIYKYISWASDMLLIPLILYIYFFLRKRYLAFAASIVLLLPAFLFPTSKGGLLSLVFYLGAMAFYVKRMKSFSIRFNRFAVPVAIIVFFSAAIVLRRYGEDIISIAQFLLIRLIDFGGGTYSYFVMGGHDAFRDYNVIDKLQNYFDTILSVLRLKEWEDPNRMAAIRLYLTGSYQHGYGQNPYFFLDGHFLFGYFGFVYAFIIGLILGYFRFARIDFLSFMIINFSLISIIADPDIVQARFISLMFILFFFIFYLTLRLFIRRKIGIPIMVYNYISKRRRMKNE